ncbi:MAG: Rdx family protein [Myxococcota bacterium]|nr:Rdx family protein [Myxococcota bacterium]
MAAQLRQTLGVEAELVVGSSGEFTVWVDGTKVVEKSAGRFPEPAAVVTAVRALSAG